jgi:chondroitin 4-sulfotransferase 11
MNFIETAKIFRRKIMEGDHFPLRKGSNGTFVFIHINKSAGTSIARSIGLPKKRHLTVKEVIAIIGKKNYEEAFSFTVVRNPWSKVVSHYQYRVHTNQTDLGANPIGFHEWVAKTYGPVKDTTYYNTPKMFMPQVDWLKDDKNEINIKKILRFEDLPNAYNEVALQLGIKDTLPVLNKTKKIDYKTQYNEESKLIVADHFKEDIELFGYEF